MKCSVGHIKKKNKKVPTPHNSIPILLLQNVGKTSILMSIRETKDVATNIQQLLHSSIRNWAIYISQERTWCLASLMYGDVAMGL